MREKIERRNRRKGISWARCRSLSGDPTVVIFRISIESGLFVPGAVDCREPGGGGRRLYGRDVPSLLAPKHDGVYHVLKNGRMRQNMWGQGKMLTLLTPSTRNPTSGTARARRRSVREQKT